MKHIIPITIYHKNHGLKTKLDGELFLSTSEYLNYVELEIKELEIRNIEMLKSMRKFMELKRQLKEELNSV